MTWKPRFHVIYTQRGLNCSSSSQQSLKQFYYKDRFSNHITLFTNGVSTAFPTNTYSLKCISWILVLHPHPAVSTEADFDELQLPFIQLMATGLPDPSSKEPNTLMATQPLTSAVSFPDESYLIILQQ